MTRNKNSEFHKFPLSSPHSSFSYKDMWLSFFFFFHNLTFDLCISPVDFQHFNHNRCLRGEKNKKQCPPLWGCFSLSAQTKSSEWKLIFVKAPLKCVPVLCGVKQHKVCNPHCRGSAPPHLHHHHVVFVSTDPPTCGSPSSLLLSHPLFAPSLPRYVPPASPGLFFFPFSRAQCCSHRFDSTAELKMGLSAYGCRIYPDDPRLWFTSSLEPSWPRFGLARRKRSGIWSGLVEGLDLSSFLCWRGDTSAASDGDSRCLVTSKPVFFLE